MTAGPLARLGDAAYGALLHLLPGDVRREFGEDMAQLFRDTRRADAGRPWQRFTTWIAALGDVVTEAWSARRDGGPARTRPSTPHTWRFAMSTLLTDLRHGLRLVRRYPASSWMAIATLALGIGANTAIFSLVDGVLLRTLPFRNPDQLASLFEKRPKEGQMAGVVAPAEFLDWRSRSASFASMAAYSETSTALTGDSDPVTVDGAAVSWGFFNVFGIAAERGRTFLPEDEAFGHSHVVVVSHGCWERRFGGDPNIVGRALVLGGTPWTIIGVLPASFHFLEPNQELWTPLVLETPGAPAPRSSHYLDVYGRLKPAVSLAQARDEMDRLGHQLADEHPNESAGHGINVESMRSQFIKPVQTSLVVLLTAVGFVLLIACVNVASLLLARAATRGREMAVRASLGASRGRLITQGLAESLVLSALGGLAALGVAVLTLRALPLVLPDQVALVDVRAITLSGRLLAFTLGLSGLTGFLFGFLPALQASRPDLTDTLKQGGRASAGVPKAARRALVVGEVALATMTLVGAGLALRSFGQVLAQPLGFHAEGRLTATVALPRRGYPTDDARRTFVDGLTERFTALPGVSAVGAINILPLSGSDSRRSVLIEDRPPVSGEPPTRMHPRSVTTGYFKAMDIPVLKGRTFGPEDTASGQPVVIVSETAARRFWPTSDPIGRRIRFANPGPWLTVVGIAGDVRHWGLTKDINPMAYLPFAQQVMSDMTFVLAGSADPATLTAGVRQAVKAADAKLPVDEAEALTGVVADSVRPQRAQATLMAAFGVVAVLLSAIGIFGVMAHLVSARTYELGVRLSLGARPRRILARLLAEAGLETGLGLALGLTAGIWLMHLERDVLFNTTPWDLRTLAVVALVLIVTALGACLVPARRAMRIDPVRALRAN
jgi:putative ABC transport system permease protein